VQTCAAQSLSVGSRSDVREPVPMLTPCVRFLLVCAMQDVTDGAFSDETCERIIDENASWWIQLAAKRLGTRTDTGDAR
jgi:hypothetical protein